MLPSDPSERHRAVAGRFGEVVDGVADWTAQSPVVDWTARDVVGHLVGWLPPLLSTAMGIELAVGPSIDDDPASAWRHHADAVQALLDDPTVAATTFDHAPMPPMPLATAIDMIYTSDVYMHVWDLARAAGQEPGLDADECERLLAGMVPMEEVLRSSGHYGPAASVADDAAVEDRLMAFIGRDPLWRLRSPDAA